MPGLKQALWLVVLATFGLAAEWSRLFFYQNKLWRQHHPTGFWAEVTQFGQIKWIPDERWFVDHGYEVPEVLAPWGPDAPEAWAEGGQRKSRRVGEHDDYTTHYTNPWGGMYSYGGSSGSGSGSHGSHGAWPEGGPPSHSGGWHPSHFGPSHSGGGPSHSDGGWHPSQSGDGAWPEAGPPDNDYDNSGDSLLEQLYDLLKRGHRFEDRGFKSYLRRKLRRLLKREGWDEPAWLRQDNNMPVAEFKKRCLHLTKKSAKSRSGHCGSLV